MGCSLKETDREDFDRQAIMQRMTSVYLRSSAVRRMGGCDGPSLNPARGPSVES